MSNTSEDRITNENIGGKWNQRSFQVPNQYHVRKSIIALFSYLADFKISKKKNPLVNTSLP